MNKDALISLLSAAGFGGAIGSVITIFLQAWLQKKAAIVDRKFMTNPMPDGNAHPKRPSVLRELKEAMRADLFSGARN